MKRKRNRSLGSRFTALLVVAILALGAVMLWNLVNESPGDASARRWRELISCVNDRRTADALALLHPDFTLESMHVRLPRALRRKAREAASFHAFLGEVLKGVHMRLRPRGQRSETLDEHSARVRATVRVRWIGVDLPLLGKALEGVSESAFEITSTWVMDSGQMLLHDLRISKLRS